MPNRRTRLDNLLQIAIEAHGGLNAWNQFESLRASISMRGLWDQKELPGLFSNCRIDLKLRQQQVSTHLPDVGAEPVRNPDVAKISFTGSVGVGKSIMRDGAETMKRVTLELGGKSPTILLDDAVLDKAVPSALLMAFLNSGQACAAGTRLLLPKSRFDQVKRAIVEAMAGFPVGDPADPKTAVGPMVSQKQYEQMQSYIGKGIEEGADVLVGGEGRPRGFEEGYFVKPTVFVNVKNDMTIAREEIFGPVLSVISYDSENEAIGIANESQMVSTRPSLELM